MDHIEEIPFDRDKYEAEWSPYQPGWGERLSQHSEIILIGFMGVVAILIFLFA